MIRFFFLIVGNKSRVHNLVGTLLCINGFQEVTPYSTNRDVSSANGVVFFYLSRIFYKIPSLRKTDPMQFVCVCVFATIVSAQTILSFYPDSTIKTCMCK